MLNNENRDGPSSEWSDLFFICSFAKNIQIESQKSMKKVIPCTCSPGTKVELAIRIVDHASRYGVRRFPRGAPGVISHFNSGHAVVEMNPAKFCYPQMTLFVHMNHLMPYRGGRDAR